MISEIINSSVPYLTDFLSFSPFERAVLSKVSYGFSLRRDELYALFIIDFKVRCIKELRSCL